MRWEECTIKECQEAFVGINRLEEERRIGGCQRSLKVGKHAISWEEEWLEKVEETQVEESKKTERGSMKMHSTT